MGWDGERIPGGHRRQGWQTESTNAKNENAFTRTPFSVEPPQALRCHLPNTSQNPQLLYTDSRLHRGSHVIILRVQRDASPLRVDLRRAHARRGRLPWREIVAVGSGRSLPKRVEHRAPHGAGGLGPGRALRRARRCSRSHIRRVWSRRSSRLPVACQEVSRIRRVIPEGVCVLAWRCHCDSAADRGRVEFNGQRRGAGRIRPVAGGRRYD